MKLHYWHKTRWGMPIRNFGDALNPWLFSRLFGNVLDSNESEVILGIGTLINDRLISKIPQAQKIHVFGTGVGYGTHLKNLPSIDEKWDIQWLRGPLSAQALGLPQSLALTDSALLVADFIKPSLQKTHQFSFMPHLYQAISGSLVWKKICNEYNILYIDPRLPVDDILEMMNHSSVVIAEAMHGAIVADALRIPWIPVITGENILHFKWDDWCASVGLTYNPISLSKVTYASYIKRSQIKRARKDFRQIMKTTPLLSSSTLHLELLQRMHTIIDNFKRSQTNV